MALSPGKWALELSILNGADQERQVELLEQVPLEPTAEAMTAVAAQMHYLKS